MGTTATTFQKVFKDPSRRESGMFEITDDNGYVFCNNYYIPEEMLIMILSYLSPRDLVFVCRRVCKYWCNVIDSQVWKIKLAKNNVPVQKINSLPWFACFWIVSKSLLGRNLVKNNCGQEKLKHWEIISNGGDGWIVEKPPVGCEEFPKECSNEDILKHNSCFATSFYASSKKQLIDLRKEGAVAEFMDIVQPHITVTDCFFPPARHMSASFGSSAFGSVLYSQGSSNFLSGPNHKFNLTFLPNKSQPLAIYIFQTTIDGFTNVMLRIQLLQKIKEIFQGRSSRYVRYSGRFDCTAVYDFKVRLLNEDYEFLHEFEVQKHVGLAEGCAWQKVSHVFQGYGPGVAYIEFIHGGMDSFFWKGHYGSKMTGASIVLSI